MISPVIPRLATAARLIETIVSADERLDAAAFVAALTPSGTFRFGGAPAISIGGQKRRSAIFSCMGRRSR